MNNYHTNSFWRPFIHKHSVSGVFHLIILLVFFGSCKKEDDHTSPDNPDPPSGVLEEVPETRDIIMYEVNERAFSQSGDFQGIINRLDSIKALSVNVIWLMPVHPIGQVNSVNSPYSVKNYKEINPEFGDKDDFKTLVTEAHKRKMAVIMDWVANHTAWDNPWITYTDWYTQVNGVIVHPPGTNWMDVADLNYSNAEMRLAMIDAMKYWVNDFYIDGFRCDAADMVPYDFWKQAIDSLNAIPNRDIIMLAEGARADHFTAGFQMNFSWDYYSKLKNVFGGQGAGLLFTAHTNEYNGIPEGKQKLRFTTNHDESAWDATPMTLFGGKQGALAASVATICLGGVPLIYGSQEVGRVNTLPFFSNSPINWELNQDMQQEYRKLLAFYSQSETMKSGTLATYANIHIAAFSKTLGDDVILVLVNTRNSTKSFTLPAEFQNTNRKNMLFSNEYMLLGQSVSLEPYEYLILGKPE